MKSTSPVLMAANHEITDQFIVDRVLDGDKDYYEVIIRRYNDRLYKLARGIIKDEIEVEDIMQETYLKAYQKLYQFKGKAKFSTWLSRILINEAFAHYNKKNKYRRLVLEDPGIKTYLSTSQKLTDENPEQKVIKENVKQLLETSIDSLDEKYRIVFIMREIEGMNVSETAECLSLTEENVKVRLHRAKAQLKNTLRESMTDIQLYEFLDPRCNRITVYVMNKIKLSA